MSYAPQPTTNSNGTLVLVTLGVCALSVLELFILVGGYLFIMGGMFFSRLNSAIEMEHARNHVEAREAARQAENQRRAEQQRQMSTPRNNQPTPPTKPPPTVQPPAVPPPPRITNTSPGTPYPNLSAVNVNDRVHILWGGTWYPGSVIEKTATQAKVHYDNYSNTFDEFVTVDRLRRMSPADKDYRNGSPVAPATRKPVDPPPPRSVPVEPTPPPPVPADPLKMLRIWSDSTGQFQLEAVFLSVQNGQVQLQRKDGKVTMMPLDKLSPPDRALIRAKYPDE